MITNNNPYTNFHELNLDFVLEYLKRMFGGTAGEVLKKDSSVDMDFYWGRLSARDVGALPDSYSPPVESVNGQTGAVELSARDVGALPANYSPPVESVNGHTGAVELTARDVGALPDSYSPPVTSVNGKIGAVTLRAADVFALPSNYVPPVESVNGKLGQVELTAQDVGALPSGTPVATLADLINLLPRVSVGPSDLISFSDGANNVPLENAVVEIAPSLSGSGEPSPSNVRTLSGRAGLTVYHSGADTASPEIRTILWESEAGMVYAGELDLTTGILTLDYVFKTFDGSEPWTWYANSNSCLLSGAIPDRVGVNDTFEITGYCSVCPTSADGILPTTFISATGRTTFNLQVSQIGINWGLETTVQAFKDKLAELYAGGTPFQLCYKIRTPQTVALTPVQIKTLLGANSFWSDAGKMAITYRADIQKYIDGRVQ